MKRISLTLFTSFVFLIVQAQYFAWGLNEIPIYSQAFVPSETNEIPIDTIYESYHISECSDLVYWQNFTLYNCKIIDSKGCRHKILYHLDPSCEKAGPIPDNDPIFKDRVGWVDKYNIVVAIRPKTKERKFNLYYHYSDKEPFLTYIIYSPEDNVDFEKDNAKILITNLFSQELPVLEVGPDDWLKVLFMNRGEAFEGWTKDYCGDKDGCYGYNIY